MKTKNLLTFLIALVLSFKVCAQDFYIECPDPYLVSWELCSNPWGNIPYEDFEALGGYAYSDCGIDKNSLEFTGIATGQDDINWEYHLLWEFTIQDSCGNIENCTGILFEKIFVNRMDDLYITTGCATIDGLEELTGLPYSTTQWITEITKEQFEAAGGSFDENEYIPFSLWIGYDDEINNSSCPLSITRTFFFDVPELCASFTVSQEIIIEDTEFPLIVSPDPITVDCSNNVPAPYSSFEEFTSAGGSATDNCVIDINSFQLVDENITGDCPKTIHRIYLIADYCGNMSTVEHSIIVDDNILPEFTTSPSPIEDIVHGEPLPQQEDLLYTDNCEINYYSKSVLPYIIDTVNGYEVTYFWEITDMCENTASTLITFNVQPPPVKYCESYGEASNEWIQNVIIGNESNSSGAGGYEDFTIFTFNVQASLTYELSLVPGFSGKNQFEYWAIWIDFDIDGTFDETEKVFSTSKKRSTVLGTLSIPNISAINTRMRVSMSNSEEPSPCGDILNGEVEDYSINITEPVPQPPVANFTAGNFNIGIGNIVSFTDLSENSPNSWEWTFEGGTPSTSTDQNPEVVYNTAGTYDVTLLVSNEIGTNTITKQNYITVEDEALNYCDSYSNNSGLEWISSVSVGNLLNESGSSTYSDFTGQSATVTKGMSYPVSLSPEFSNKSQREFWNIWIDFNGDMDFDDANENVFIAFNAKSMVTGNIIIPEDAISGTTRMRISMKNNLPSTPCEIFDRGEVEDYSIIIDDILKNGTLTFDDYSGNVNKEIILFPNPANTVINIKLNNINKSILHIYDARGVILLNKQLNSNLEKIDLQNFVSGIYYLEVITKNVIFREKFVKK